MIKINLSPVRSDEPQLKTDWNSPVLTVNGQPFDLSELPDGATAQHPTLGMVHRTGDDYEVTLRLPHGPEHWIQVSPTELHKASYEQRFPEPIIMTSNGQVPVPRPEIKEVEIPEEEEE